MAIRSISMAVTMLVLSASVCAQTDPAARGRTEIKAETASAERGGRLTPAGEGRPNDGRTLSRSTKTRVERKTETLQARRNNELMPAGGAWQQKLDVALRAQRPTTTRAERKAETRRAIAQHELLPAGERPQAVKN